MEEEGSNVIVNLVGVDCRSCKGHSKENDRTEGLLNKSRLEGIRIDMIYVAGMECFAPRRKILAVQGFNDDAMTG